MEYIFHLIIIILLYTMLSQSLVLVAGYAGMISLAQIAFFGIGAYTTAILSLQFKLPFIINLPIAIVISGILALVISKIAIKTVDEYFIIITLGIQIVIHAVMNNWAELTNGPLGISGIAPITFFGYKLESNFPFFLLTLFFAVIIYLIVKFTTRSPFGLVLKALSEDEIFAKSLGKDVSNAKIISFTLGAMLAVVPGVLYAHYITYVDPTSFTIDESIFILSIVIIGGMQNLWGALIASALLILLPEALRFLGIPNNIAANIRQIIYGMALIIVMFRFSVSLLHTKSVHKLREYY